MRCMEKRISSYTSRGPIWTLSSGSTGAGSTMSAPRLANARRNIAAWSHGKRLAIKSTTSAEEKSASASPNASSSPVERLPDSRGCGALMSCRPRLFGRHALTRPGPEDFRPCKAQDFLPSLRNAVGPPLRNSPGREATKGRYLAGSAVGVDESGVVSVVAHALNLSCLRFKMQAI